MQEKIIKVSQYCIKKKINCGICQPTDSEILDLLDQIQKRLEEFSKKKKQQSGNTNNTVNTNNGFKRLILIVFSSKFSKSNFSVKCHHLSLKKLKNYQQRQLMKRLDFNQKRLDQICDELALKLGKFNFHLDMLTQQGKYFKRYFQKPLKQIQIKEQIVSHISTNEKNGISMSEIELKKNQEENKILPINYQYQQNMIYPSYAEPIQTFQPNIMPSMIYKWFYPPSN